MDPVAGKYPSLTPYAYAASNPLALIDIDGRDIYLVIGGNTLSVNKAMFAGDIGKDLTSWFESSEAGRALMATFGEGGKYANYNVFIELDESLRVPGNVELYVGDAKSSNLSDYEKVEEVEQGVVPNPEAYKIEPGKSYAFRMRLNPGHFDYGFHSKEKKEKQTSKKTYSTPSHETLHIFQHATDVENGDGYLSNGAYHHAGGGKGYGYKQHCDDIFTVKFRQFIQRADEKMQKAEEEEKKAELSHDCS